MVLSGFPKQVRILRSKDFRRVYDTGTRFATSLFTAFCLRDTEDGRSAPKIGFTTPRALGGAVVRNRLKRRVREALRAQLGRIEPGWWIVINPRRKALNCPSEEVRREVERLVKRCGAA